MTLKTKRAIVIALVVVFGLLILNAMIRDWDGQGKGRALNALLGGIVVLAFFGLRKGVRALWRRLRADQVDRYER